MASMTPSLSTQAPRSGGHDKAKKRETEEGKYHHVHTRTLRQCSERAHGCKLVLELAHQLPVDEIMEQECHVRRH